MGILKAMEFIFGMVENAMKDNGKMMGSKDVVFKF